MVQSQPGQTVLETLSQKYPSQKVVEHLSSNHETLSSRPSITKKIKKNTIKKKLVTVFRNEEH
jgi:hypothetical protein